MGTVAAAENVTDDSTLQLNEAEQIVQSDDSGIADDINVTFDEQMWEENLTDITVDLPEEASGEFCLKVGDDVIYNQTITEKSFKVPVKITKPKFELVVLVYPPYDCRHYDVTAFYNGVDLNLNRTLKVMKFSPDYNLLRFPKEILQNSDPQMLRMSLMFPRSANGIVEIYLNDRLFNKTQVRGSYINVDYTNVTRLDLGNHTLKVVYYNDTYYHDINRTFNFEVVNAVISIPETVNIGHDTCVSVDVLKGVQGTVRIYLDGKLIANKKYEQYFVFSLEDYVKWNSSEVVVEFISKQFSRNKTQKINVTYNLEVYSPSRYIYGEDNVIELYLPDNLNNNLLNVEINGVKYSFTHPENIMNNILEVDISRLAPGNYTLFMSYPGDERFVAKNNTFNFTVAYAIIAPDYFAQYDGKYEVYLNLPSDAKGKLNVYLDGKLYRSSAMSNGKAVVFLSNLAPGHYMFNASYDGDDYIVYSNEFDIRVSPKITADTYFRTGEKKSITLSVPKDCSGVMTVTIDGGKPHNVKVTNGKATFSLSNLEEGYYDVEVRFKGENGFEDYDYFDIEVLPAKIKIQAKDVNVLYKHSAKYKVKLFGNDAKPLKNKWVKFKIGKKTYKAKTNSKGIATIKLKKLKAKTHKITVSYGKVKVTKKIRVKMLKLDVSKSKTKVKLTAKLYKKIKGKTVKFKVGSKKYSVKTNSKGIAKLTVKMKTSSKVKFQAKCLKSTVVVQK